MKKVSIGLTAGLNPLVALSLKALLIGEGVQRGLNVDVICDDEEPIAGADLSDRKIAALKSVLKLEAAGCASAVVPGVQNDPWIPELQKEVTFPLVRFYDGVAAEASRRGAKRIDLLGVALEADFFEAKLAGAAEVIPVPDDLRAEYLELQSGERGLKRVGLTEAHEARLRKACAALTASGANLIIPVCGQIARYAREMQSWGFPVMDVLADTAARTLDAADIQMPKPFKVGLIGGLGPAATVDLYDKIVKATNAATDQEHIKLVVEQNPQVPDRTVALLEGGEDPTIALCHAALRLERDGCTVIVVPCNTAHAFLPQIARNIRTPFINMQQVTLEEIRGKLGDKARIGLLATTGTVRSGLYAQKAREMGLELTAPDEARQAFVMDAIYGPLGAKAGFTTGHCRETLLAAAEHLVVEKGCNCLILGCTELPLILDESDDFIIAGSSVVVVDPTFALARRVAAEAGKAKPR